MDLPAINKILESEGITYYELRYRKRGADFGLQTE
jgi:hypothetical protein